MYRTTFSDELLARTVGEVRRELDLDKESVEPSPADRRAFVLWSLASVATYAATWIVVLLPLATFVLLVMLLATSDCLNFWRF